MAASTVFRGRPIGMEVGGTVLCITKWEINETSDRQDVTNSCSPGEGREYVEGSPEDTVSFEGFVKSDQNITVAPLKLLPGEVHTVKLLYRKTNPIFKQAEIFIDTVRTSGDIKTMVSYAVTAVVQGDVTQPIYG